MLYAHGCEIINVNTDGVAFVPGDNVDYLKIAEEWEKMFHLTLEEEDYKLWIQTDVNNYVAIEDDGQIKTKGGDTNKYVDYEKGGVNYYFNNANTRIIHKAVVDKLLYDKDITETIYENLDKPILYQYILQAGGTYQGTFDRDGNKYQKVNRVFACKEYEPFKVELVKKRADGGYVKFADAPTNMLVWNQNVSEFISFEDVVDTTWYVELAQKVYERWSE